MVDVASLRFDVIFKKAFSHPDVFCQFVHDVLGISIHVDRVIQNYKYPEQVGYVGIEYDLFAEDITNRAIVEIQHVQEVDFFDRFLYYHLIGIVQQVKTHTDYRFPKAVYTVVVLTGGTRSRNGQVPPFSVATSRMEAFNEYDRPMGVYPHRLVFLNPQFRNERTPESIWAWLELIDDSLDEQVDESRYRPPIFQRVIEEIKRDNVSPEELKRIKDEAVVEHFHREAFEEGRNEEKKAIARSMLGRGMDVTFIAEITGLSPEEITNLGSE